MTIFKRLLLYIVCFYYAVLTPGKDDESSVHGQTWKIVTVSIIQALIAACLFEFFDWPVSVFPWLSGDTSFLGILGTVGLFVGLWTLVGGLAYPALQEILDEDNKQTMAREGAAFQRNSAARQERMRKEREAFMKLSEKDPDACMDLIKKADRALSEGREDQIEFEILKNSTFLTNQYARLVNESLARK